MMLSEKIVNLRKQKGWSQEQMAEQLEVSRQAVSKWESGASVPDLDKIIKLSDLFGVTTDYLLREEENKELRETESIREEERKKDESKEHRVVQLSDAEDYMELVKSTSSKIALGVSMCILSPVCLILLCGLSEYGNGRLTEDAAGALGVVILLVMCAAGAAVLISNGMRLSEYEYLEKEIFVAGPGVKKMAERGKKNFELQFRKSVVTGVTLCILSVIPIIAAAGFDAAEWVYVICTGILPMFIASGVYQFVSAGNIQGGYLKLLQEGDYSKEQKEVNKRTEFFPGIYWCFVTAVYLGLSFCYDSWSRSWIIWPVAGVFFAAVMGIISTVAKPKKE
ncbi:MAG: helix-turn-helix domain-containing protein [Ruminococcus sp.]|jgi:transcriptional regulator with XRE-family HTH domain